MGGLLSRVHAHGETEFGENGQVSTSRRYGYPPSDGKALCEHQVGIGLTYTYE